jgi:predicted GIY-YIG superfamily endonuclease
MEKPAYYCVYILQTKIDPDRFYTGFTENIENRLKDHNSGKDTHTSKYKPWDLIAYHAFKDRSKALSFEKYLKACLKGFPPESDRVLLTIC